MRDRTDVACEAGVSKLDTRAIEADLNLRIEAAGRLWNKGIPAEFPSLTIKRGSKNYGCKVEIAGLIHRPDRSSEKHCLMFKLSMPGDEPVFAAELEVRMKPDLTEGNSVDSPPYVSVHRHHPREGENGTKTSVFWEQHLRANEYRTLVGLDDQQWFTRFLERATRDHFQFVFERL